MVVIRYSLGAGTVLGLVSSVLLRSPSGPTPPRPVTIARFGVARLSSESVLVCVGTLGIREAGVFLAPRTAATGVAEDRALAKQEPAGHALAVGQNRRPVLPRSEGITTTATRASYAGARQLRAARDAIAAINKPRRTPPPRPDTEWATPAPASPPPCRATPRHQRAAAARRARSPTRASV